MIKCKFGDPTFSMEYVFLQIVVISVGETSTYYHLLFQFIRSSTNALYACGSVIVGAVFASKSLTFSYGHTFFVNAREGMFYMRITKEIVNGRGKN